MMPSLQIPANKWAINRLAVLLYLAYAVMMLLALHTYIAWQSVNVLLGVIAMPMVITFQPKHKQSVRYGILALCCSALCLLLPVKTVLYFAIVLACFFVAETCLGKINLLPVLVAGFMSPVFQFTATVFSFPVRLQLTALAGNMMNMAGIRSVVAGNMIVCNGNEFSVDPACMGLNMLVTSLLLQVIMIAVYQKKYNRQLTWWQVMSLLFIAFALNVASNLFRIISLVWFNILPGTIMHDVTGMFCLLIYVIAPAVFITRWMIIKMGRTTSDRPASIVATSKTKIMGLHSILLIIAIWGTVSVIQHDEYNNVPVEVKTIAGYATQRVTADIVKLQNDRSLIYLKYIPGFYNADHHPMICWQGSGYEFRKVQKQSINGLMVFTAVLQHGNGQLYTAWWYDNGAKRTIDQLTWRWDVLRGAKPYSVVNVTTVTSDQLVQEVKAILNDNRLKALL
jgi:exosortase N